MGLAEEVLAGNRRSLARLATHVENDDEVGRTGLAKLYPHTGRAHVVGVTGPPGAGKSTLINGLIGALLKRTISVAVVAVDPSSPLSGGATLGDRIRMLDWQANPNVFIRSMASRGRTGGLAPATAGMIHLLDAGGFDLVLVETVGVGQEEIDVSRLVDTLVLVQVPASGDGVQLLKAGILEFADVFVVNKADLPGAEDVTRGLRLMLGFSMHGQHEWAPPVLKCSAVKGESIAKIADAIRDHHAYLTRGEHLRRRRRAIAQAEIADHVNAAITHRFAAENARHDLAEGLVAEVANRRLTPFAAAQTLLEHWGEAKR